MYYTDSRTQRINAMEDLILDRLGAADAFDAITRAMSSDAKESIYEYIIRSYDLDPDDAED